MSLSVYFVAHLTLNDPYIWYLFCSEPWIY